MSAVPGQFRLKIIGLLGALLMLVGLFVCARGGVLILSEIGSMYSQASDDALSEPAVSEEERSDRLKRHAMSVLIGFAPLGIGFTLVLVNRMIVQRHQQRERMHQLDRDLRN